MPKISIIIPVYNSEKYLRECLDSIVSQTLQDIEIIVVNDASSDDSQSIIDEYMTTDARIQCIVHPENLGQGGARNTGIAAARGDYITFVDSDDWIDPQTCQNSYAQITQHNADMLSFGFRKFRGTKTLERAFSGSEAPVEIWQSPRELLHAYYERKISGMAWGKVYRTEIWRHGLLFQEQLYLEDAYLLFEILQCCQKSLAIPDMLYHYRQHQGSLMHQKSSPYKIYGHIRAYAHQKEILGQSGYAELLPLCHEEICNAIERRLLRQEKLRPLDYNLQRYWIQTAAEHGLAEEMAEVLARELCLYSRFVTSPHWLRLLRFISQPPKEKLRILKNKLHNCLRVKPGKLK